MRASSVVLLGFVSLLAACSATPTPPPTLPATPAPSPTPAETPFTLFDGPVPNIPAYVGPLPEGAVARLGFGTIQRLWLTPDGTRLILWGNGYSVVDADTFETIWSRPSPTGGQSVLSTDGSLLAESSRLAVTLVRTGTFDAVWSVDQEPPRPDAGMHDVDFKAVFSPDGSLLATTSIAGEVSPYAPALSCDVALRAVETGEIVHRLKTTSCNLEWSPDGRFLAAYGGGGSGRVEVWETASGERVMSIEGVFGDWSTQGTLFSVRLIDQTTDETSLAIYTVTTGQTAFTLDPMFEDVLWSPDGETVAAISQLYQVAHLLDARSGQTIKEHKIERHDDFVWSSDNRLLGVKEVGGTMDIIDWETGQTALPLTSAPATGSPGVGRSLDWSPDGKAMYVNSYSGRVAAWDTQTGELVGQMVEMAEVTSLAFGPNGALLAAGYTGGAVVVWDTASMKPLRQLGGGEKYEKTLKLYGGSLPAVVDLAWSPDGRWLAGPRGDGRGQVWDMTTGQVVKDMSLNVDSSQHVDWSPDGRTLAVTKGGDEGGVVVFDSLTWEEAVRFEYAGVVTSVQWLPDSRLAISAYVGDALIFDVRDIETGKSATWHNDPHYDFLAWSPDGTRVLFSDGIWDARTWTERVTMPDDLPQGWSVTAWSSRSLGDHPGLELIATTVRASGYPGKIVLLDASTGKPVASFSGHSGQVTHIEWSPDGRLLATASWDGTVILWDVARLLAGQ